MWKFIANIRKKGIPLPLCIIALVLGAVAFMVLLNISHVRYESVLLGERYAIESFRMLAKSSQREIRTKIDPILAVASVAIHSPPLPEDVLRGEVINRAHLKTFIQPLTAHTDTLAINYGYVDGTFLSVTALRDAYVRARYDAPDAATFVLWCVTRSPLGDLQEIWIYFNTDLEELARKQVPHNYDPRSTPWYMAAMREGKLTITPPYIFTTSRELGVTAALPLQDGEGAYSINIMLRNLSALLEEVPLSPRGAAFILDEQRRILAERSPESAKLPGNAWQPLLPISEHPMRAVISVGLQQMDCSGNTDPLLVDTDDAEHFYFCTPIPMGTRQLNLVMISPIKDFMGIVDRFFRNTLLFAAITMFIFTPLATWLSFRVGESLLGLLRETQRVRRFSWGTPPHVESSIREIRRLARAITSMKNSIHKRTDALKDVQNSLEATVRQRTTELRTALELAEEATEAKSRFLSTMSHELRTPMNAIVGFTYLFSKKNLTAEQEDYLEKIRISSEALLCIINDVLDLSKIEAGRMEIEHIPYSLSAVLNTVCSIINYSAREKHLDFVVQQEEGIPDTLMGDPARLHQILLNLASNAVKFTIVGSVTISVRTETLPEGLSAAGEGVPPVRHLHFRVADTGIGMSEEQMQRLFMPFAQADSSISRKYGGTGLGLAICRQLSGLMGGSIRVESRLGEGTVFEVFLPLEEAPANVSATDAASEGTDTNLWSYGGHVLVVDDNAINREIAVALLENAFLAVDAAENGEEALRKVTETRYDLVFMDMQMPVMDGLEAVKRMRSMEAQGIVTQTDVARVPIVAMTANAMQEDRRRCIEAGMNDYIAKPIVPTLLLAVLARWLPRGPRSEKD